MSSASHSFHRWINPASRSAPASHEIDASERERASLAGWLGIPAVRALHADLRLSRESADAVAVAGTFKADVDLICGVTLETFGETLTGTIDVVFSKDAGLAPGAAGEAGVGSAAIGKPGATTTGAGLGASGAAAMVFGVRPGQPGSMHAAK